MKPEQVKQMADRLRIAKCNHCGKYPTTTRVLGKKMEEAAEALLALLDEILALEAVVAKAVEMQRALQNAEGCESDNPCHGDCWGVYTETRKEFEAALAARTPSPNRAGEEN